MQDVELNAKDVDFFYEYHDVPNEEDLNNSKSYKSSSINKSNDSNDNYDGSSNNEQHNEEGFWVQANIAFLKRAIFIWHNNVTTYYYYYAYLYQYPSKRENEEVGRLIYREIN